MLREELSRFEAIDVRANGIDLRVRTAGQGDRLALLLHGFPEAWFSWRAQIPAPAELGYRVWAPDLRGYGESERPRGVDAYRMEKLLGDVAGLIDAAKAKEVVLIAHDWGGAIAWQFAMRRVRKIDRLVALNIPHPALFAKHLFRPGPQMLRSWYIFMFQLPWLPEWYLGRHDHHAIEAAFASSAVDRRRFPPELLELYKKNAARPGALNAMVNYYRAAMRAGPRGPGSGKAPLEVPTLMIWGERDAALGKEMTFGTERYVRDLTVRYVPHASHWVQQEAPETVNRMTSAWLRGERVPEAREIQEPPVP